MLLCSIFKNKFLSYTYWWPPKYSLLWQSFVKEFFFIIVSIIQYLIIWGLYVKKDGLCVI